MMARIRATLFWLIVVIFAGFVVFLDVGSAFVYFPRWSVGLLAVVVLFPKRRVNRPGFVGD